MTTLMKLVLPLFLIFSISAHAKPAPPDPAELLTQMDAILRGQSHAMTVTMNVQAPRWNRHYKIQVWMKGLDYSFSRVLEPAKAAGQSFLRIQGRLWQYLPSAERTILIPPSLMLDNFLGSDFSNDDFVKMSYLPRDYASRILGEETLGGFEAYRLELVPKPDAPVTYSKLEIWVRKSDSGPLQWQCFNERGELIRTLEYSEFKSFGAKEVPTVWHMKNHSTPGRETVIKIVDAQYDIALADSLFTKSSLEKYP